MSPSTPTLETATGAPEGLKTANGGHPMNQPTKNGRLDPLSRLIVKGLPDGITKLPLIRKGIKKSQSTK